MMNAFGTPELADDPRFATNAARMWASRRCSHRSSPATTCAIRATSCSPRWRRSACRRGPINTVEDIFTDPHILARGMRVDLPDPGAKGGTIPGVASPMVISGERMTAPRPSPALGAHTQEVLADPDWGRGLSSGASATQPWAVRKARSEIDEEILGILDAGGQPQQVIRAGRALALDRGAVLDQAPRPRRARWRASTAAPAPPSRSRPRPATHADREHEAEAVSPSVARRWAWPG